MHNKRPIVIGIILAAVLLALFIWPKINNPARDLISQWSKNGIDCLTMGHTNIDQHFHPELKIVVDGVEEDIPANVGIVNSCMAEVHTHDASGTIHIESASGDKIFHLKNFFTVYGVPLEREGHRLFMTVDGQKNEELGGLVLKDKQQIVLEYKKIPN